MKITCPACNANYRLPDERLQGKNRIFKINCKKCGAEIRVRGVETPSGNVACGQLLVAGGLWGPELQKLIGQPIPLQPLQHLFAWGAPIEGLECGAAELLGSASPFLVAFFATALPGVSVENAPSYSD